MKLSDFPMLLVGDDPEEILRIQQCLAQANLVNPLRIVNDGRKAIAYLSGQEAYADRESHPFPSLLLLDLTLSQPSGIEVLAWIRSQQNLRTLPVILLTSSMADQDDSESLSALGVSSYLAKPVECEQLLEKMKSIGMYWMILDNTRPQARQPGVSLQSRRVLVVDRDADFIRSIGQSLRRRAPPIVVESAVDAADALRRLTRVSLDALVYERGIEDANESGFLDKVRALKPDLPLFVLCEQRDEAFAVRAIQNGVTGLIQKQVRQDLFSDELHGLLVAAMTPEICVAPVLESKQKCSMGAGSYRSNGKNTGPGRRHDTDILGNEIAFQKTSWDLIRACSQTKALDVLIRIYWKPLYFFVRRQGFGNEEAKDIVQEFLKNALEHRMIPRADPLRGRFRTFLLAALTNFLKDRRRSGGRLKRGGGHAPVSLDLEMGEPRYARAVNTGEPPETILDRAWAKDLLAKCIQELEGMPSHLQAFELQMRGMDYVAIGKATGLTQTAAKTAVHRLRVRLRGIIRSHLSSPNATDEEVGRQVAEFSSLLA